MTEIDGDVLVQWRPESAVSADEAAVWSQFLTAAGGNAYVAIAQARAQAESLDAEAEPYLATTLWSIIVRRDLAAGQDGLATTLLSIRELAEAIRHGGDRRKIVPLYKWLHAQWLALEGPDDAHSIMALRDLAWTMNQSGDRVAALPLARDAEAKSRLVFGDKHCERVRAMAYLVDILDNLSKEKEAEQIAEEAWKIAKEEFGPLDRLTLECAAAYGQILVGLGRRIEGTAVGDVVLAGRRKTLGEDHPATGLTMSVYARRIGAEGRGIEALDLAKRSYSILQDKLGSDHPKFLTALRNLATCLSRVGDYTAARDRRIQGLAARIKTYGENHPNTWSERNDLAFSYRKLGNSEKALLLYREVYERRKQSNPNSRSTEVSMNNLGFTLMDLGQYSEALELLEKCYQQRALNRGEDRLATVMSLKNLGVCYSRMGLPEKGLPLLQLAAQKRSSLRGEDHVSTAVALHDLGKCYSSLSRYEEASESFARCQRIRKEKFGKAHPSTISVEVDLIKTYLQLGQLDDSTALLKVTLASITSTMPGGLTWLRATKVVLEVVASVIVSGKSVEWRDTARTLSAKYIEAIDLTDPEESGHLRRYFASYHSAWMSLCFAAPDGVSEIPRILAAIQGREMAAMVLADIEARAGAFPEGDPRQRYLDTVQELRRLRMMLRAQENRSDEDGSGEDPETGGEDGSRLIRKDPVASAAAAKNLAKSRAVLLSRHSELIHQFRSQREELAQTNKQFATAYAAPNTSVEALCELLEPQAALVLLFSRALDAGVVSHHACCMLADGQVTTLALPRLAEVLSEIGVAAKQAASDPDRSFMRGGQELFSAIGQTVPDLGEQVVERACTQQTHADNEALVRQVLWDPLRNLYPQVRRWHVATHQDLHLLPIHLGLEADHYCVVHPGLLFFWLQKMATPPTAAIKDRRFLVHLDAAVGSSRPIPFVEVEAALVRSIWGNAMVQVEHGKNTLDRLQAAEPTFDALLMVAHGDEHVGPPRQTVIYLDAAQQLQLDVNSVLSAKQRPKTVLVSACVAGRVSEDDAGEPLGLVSAFFLTGGRFVLAPLQPISDFHMPLFMGLFHWAWRETGDPVTATRLARHQALTGEWPEGFVDHIHGAYAPTMERMLAVAWDKRLDRSYLRDVVDPMLRVWPLPEKQKYEWNWGGKASFLEKYCGTSHLRKNSVKATLDRLLDPSVGTPPALRQIRDWTVAFGA